MLRGGHHEVRDWPCKAQRFPDESGVKAGELRNNHLRSWEEIFWFPFWPALVIPSMWCTKSPLDSTPHGGSWLRMFGAAAQPRSGLILLGPGLS